jgi:hypothetical protein
MWSLPGTERAAGISFGSKALAPLRAPVSWNDDGMVVQRMTQTFFYRPRIVERGRFR